MGSQGLSYPKITVKWFQNNPTTQPKNQPSGIMTQRWHQEHANLESTAPRMGDVLACTFSSKGQLHHIHTLLHPSPHKSNKQATLHICVLSVPRAPAQARAPNSGSCVPSVVASSNPSFGPEALSWWAAAATTPKGDPPPPKKRGRNRPKTAPNTPALRPGYLQLGPSHFVAEQTCMVLLWGP